EQSGHRGELLVGGKAAGGGRPGVLGNLMSRRRATQGPGKPGHGRAGIMERVGSKQARRLREKTNVSPFPGWCGVLMLACLALPSLAQGAEPDSEKPFTVKVVKDIAYYEGPDQHKAKHKLDLYVPEGAKDFPVLVFVHGGAWAHGDKNFLG